MAERKLTIRAEANTANLQRGMATASASTRGFGKSIEQGITKHAAGIRMTGIAIAGLGAAVTGMAVVSIKAAVDFEKQLANVSTMLDNISMKHMPEYAEGLREMSKEFGESTETLSKGLYDILSASIAPSKALDVLAVSAKAATAGLTDTGVAADAITTVINSYGMAAEDAGKVSDILFAIIKRGKTTFAELGPAIGKVAATASIAGVSFEELGATIATVTRAGIRTDEAMTSVNGVLRAFLKPTDDAAEAAKKFGFELNTNTLRTIGLQGVMELLTEATAEQLAQMFPNIRGLKAIAAAMKDAAGFAEDYKFMLNAAGLTEEAFRKQTETAAFAFAQLKQQFIDILRVIGAQFIPIIKTEFLPMLLKVADHAKVWIEKFKDLSPSVKKFLLVLGPILIAFGGLIALLPTLIPMLHLLGVAFHAALGPIGLVTGAIALITTAFLLFREASKTSELEAMASAYSDLTDTLKEKKGNIDNLINTVEDLRNKTELTKEETYNLKAAEEALGIYFPTLGGAAEDAASKIDILTVAKKESLELTKEIMEMELSLAETEKGLAEIELARFERNEDESAKEKKRIEKRLKFMRENAEALINLSIREARFTSASIEELTEAYKENGLIIEDFKKKLNEISEDRKKGLNVEIKLENLKQEVVEKALDQNREYIKTQEDLTIVTLESARTHITLENNLASATLKVKGLQGSLESLGETVEAGADAVKEAADATSTFNKELFDKERKASLEATLERIKNAQELREERLRIALTSYQERKELEEELVEKIHQLTHIKEELAQQEFDNYIALLRQKKVDEVLIQDYINAYRAKKQEEITKKAFQEILKRIKDAQKERLAKLREALKVYQERVKMEKDLTDTIFKLTHTREEINEKEFNEHIKLLRKKKVSEKIIQDYINAYRGKKLEEITKKEHEETIKRIKNAEQERLAKLREALKVYQERKAMEESLTDKIFEMTRTREKIDQKEFDNYIKLLKKKKVDSKLIEAYITAYHAQKEKEKIRATKIAIKEIEDEYFKLTHTQKQLLDKQWKAEKKRLVELRVGEKALQDAKYIFYYDYNQKVKRLLDSLSADQKRYYEKVKGLTIDWGNLTEKEIEDIIKEIGELEKEWEKAYDNMSDEAKDWYIKLEGYTGDFTEFTVAELAAIEKAYKTTTGRIKQNWSDAFKGFTTELWVQFKTIGLEKLGELGKVISALGEIIKGDLMVGVKSLAGSFINLLFQSEGFKKLMEAINPIIQMVANAFGMLFKPLIPIAETLMNIFKPVLEALGPLFRIVGEILAATLVPVLKILAPIFRIVGDAIYAVATVIVAVWNAIVSAYNSLLGWLFGYIDLLEVPEKPSYQKGGLIPQGAKGIQAEPGELVLSKPITDWLREALSVPGPMERGVGYAEGGVLSGGAEGSVTVNVPRGAVVVYGDIRTKMDVEELEDELGRKLGERVGKEFLRSVPL